VCRIWVVVTERIWEKTEFRDLGCGSALCDDTKEVEHDHYRASHTTPYIPQRFERSRVRRHDQPLTPVSTGSTSRMNKNHISPKSTCLQRLCWPCMYENRQKLITRRYPVGLAAVREPEKAHNEAKNAIRPRVF